MTPQTQRIAFESVKPDLGDRQQAVLDCIKHSPKGLTLFEICDDLHVYPNEVSGRITELVKMGWLKDSGGQRRNPRTGLRACVWVMARPEDRQLNLL